MSTRLVSRWRDSSLACCWYFSCRFARCRSRFSVPTRAEGYGASAPRRRHRQSGWRVGEAGRRAPVWNSAAEPTVPASPTANHSPAEVGEVLVDGARQWRRTARRTPACDTTIGTAPGGAAGDVVERRQHPGEQRRPRARTRRPSPVARKPGQPASISTDGRDPATGRRRPRAAGGRSTTGPASRRVGEDLGRRRRRAGGRTTTRATRRSGPDRARQRSGELGGAVATLVAERRIGLALPASQRRSTSTTRGGRRAGGPTSQCCSRRRSAVGPGPARPGYARLRGNRAHVRRGREAAGTAA